MWGVYNNYLPVLLQAGGANFNVLGSSRALGFGIGAFAVGIIMSIDNVAGAVLKVVFGPIVDQVRSRKRILLISGAVAAVAYALIPVGFLMITPEASGQMDLLTGPFIFTFAMLTIMIGGWGVAEMAESSLFHVVVSSKQRSKTVSYRVFVGGLAFVVTLLIGNRLYEVNLGLPFWIGAGFYSLTLILYALVIKEPDHSTFPKRESEEGRPFFTRVREALSTFTPEHKDAFLKIGVAKFLLIFGVMAFQTYASSYLVNELGISEAEAGNYVAIFFAGYMLAAIPSGFIANRIGRKRLLLVFLALYTFVGFFEFFFGTPATLIPAFILVGMSTSASDIIPLSMAADTAPSNQVMGTTMGLYFFIATMSAIISVPFFGWVFELTNNNYNLMWLGVGIAGVIGFLVMYSKKGTLGEAKDGQESIIPHAL